MSTSTLTVAGFIKLINPKDETSRRLWLESCREDVGDEKWYEIGKLPLTREVVIQLAIWIAEKISEEALHWSAPEPYKRTLDCGHAFLRDIHRIAVENGIRVELGEIDQPLTPTEMMMEAGLVKVDKDGMVKLTPEGEGATESVEKQLHPKG